MHAYQLILLFVTNNARASSLYTYVKQSTATMPNHVSLTAYTASLQPAGTLPVRYGKLCMATGGDSILPATYFTLPFLAKQRLILANCWNATGKDGG